MRKKIYAVLLVLAMALIGCGSGENFIYPEEDIRHYDPNEYFDSFNITISAEKESLSEEEVDAYYNGLIADHSQTKSVDKEAAVGSVVNIDYEGSVDGEVFEGGSDKGVDVEIGSGKFLKDFENALTGHKAGDEFDAEVKFPEDYAEHLAGKIAVFSFKINEVKEKVEATDDWAQETLGIESLSALKDKIREFLEEEKTHEYFAKAEDELFEYFKNIETKKEIPESLIERLSNMMKNQLISYSETNEVGIEEAAAAFGLSRDNYMEDIRTLSEDQMKTIMAFYKIAKKEKIMPSEEDIENDLKNTAGQQDMTKEEYLQKYPDAYFESVDYLITNNALNVLMRKYVDGYKDHADHYYQYDQ